MRHLFQYRSRGPLAAASVAFSLALVGILISAGPSIAEALPQILESGTIVTGSAVVPLDSIRGTLANETEVSSWKPDEQQAQQRGNILVYDNMTSSTGGSAHPDLRTVFGDLLSLSGGAGLELTSVSAVVFTLLSGTLETAEFEIRVFDATGWNGTGYPDLEIASFFGEFVLNLEGFEIATVTINLPEPVIIPSDDVLVTIQMVEHTGTTTRFGVYSFNPPTVGTSDNGSAFRDNAQQPAAMYVAQPNLGNLGFTLRARQPCHPDIGVDETPLNFTLALNSRLQFPVSVSNENGCAPLDYTLSLLSCNLDGAPWTASGTVLPGAIGSADVTFDLFGWAPGSHTCWLSVSSNDPDTPEYFVPINFTVTGTVADAAPGVCYATQGVGGISDWVEIDPTTGVGTVSGTTARPVTDLTIDPDGRIWTMYENSLYYIDAASGAMILRGLVGCWEEMAAYGDLLYGIDCNDQLFQIDPDTGAQSALGLITPSMDGFAIHPATGVFYMTEADAGSGTDNLYSMDVLGGGSLTLVGQLGLGLPIGDITFYDQGNLLGVVGEAAGPTSTVSIDPSTGSATIVGETGINHLSGLASTNCPLRFEVSPPSLDVSVALGEEILLVDAIEISNVNGCVPLEYSITSDCGMSAPSGTVPVGAALQVSLLFHPFGFEPGTYLREVSISSDDLAFPTEHLAVNFSITGTVADATPGVCYATQGVGGNTDWVEIDSTTGVGTVSGTTARPASDLTIDPDGRIWAPYDDYLYYIDAASGAMIQRGLVGCVEEMAAFGGLLYAIGCNGDLLPIDPDTGVQSALATIIPSMDGFAIDPTTGVFYMTEADAGPGTDNLYSMDVLGGGSLTLVGPLGLGLPIGDITFDGAGDLLAVVGEAVGPTSLVLVNKTTGSATIVGETGINYLAGLACTDGSVSDVPEVDSPLPTMFALRGASPNPFSQTTHIAFDIPEAGHVQLSVFDVLGRRVATVLDQQLPAGTHSAPFDADGLSFGTYFYELRANGHREVQKVSILR